MVYILGYFLIKEEMYIVENEEISLYGNPGDTISVIAIKVMLRV